MEIVLQRTAIVERRHLVRTLVTCVQMRDTKYEFGKIVVHSVDEICRGLSTLCTCGIH